MWKAELSLIELFFRGKEHKRKLEEGKLENEYSVSIYYKNFNWLVYSNTQNVQMHPKMIKFFEEKSDLIPNKILENAKKEKKKSVVNANKKKKKSVVCEENNNTPKIRLDTRRGPQYQARIPELKNEDKNEIRQNEIRQNEPIIYSYEPLSEPPTFQSVRPAQKAIDHSDRTKPPLIQFQTGPFYRILEVFTGKDEECKDGECIASNHKCIKIDPEDIETDDFLKSILEEKFNYFTAMILQDKELVPYFVHEDILKKNFNLKVSVK